MAYNYKSHILSRPATIGWYAKLFRKLRQHNACLNVIFCNVKYCCEFEDVFHSQYAFVSFEEDLRAWFKSNVDFL